MSSLRPWFLGLLLPATACLAAVDFQKEVQPILEAHCTDCHDAQTRKGGIALDSFHSAHQLSDSGEPLFIPKQPETSLLLRRICASNPKEKMPPKGDPLSPAQIQTLRDWIAEGAVWPDDGWRPKKHWAYERPTLPTPPADDSGRGEIDAFIHHAQRTRNLSPNPDAEPAVQLRRVFLDLTGLPPDLPTVDAFLADPSDAAYQNIVDRLLQSPQFGERWARPWLDLARYADSEGYQRDQLRTLWPWRDWVIQALNADMPYDQFTIEQLAGDLLPNPSLPQKIATGFQRNSPLNLEAGTDPNEDHYKQVVDRVNTLGAVWLGSTLACAQCHNHKYDPFSIVEYYQLFAFFNQTPMESRRISGNAGALRYSGPDLSLPSSQDQESKRLPLESDRQSKIRALHSHLRPVLLELSSDSLRASSLPMELQEILQMKESERCLEDCALLVKNLLPKDPAARQLLAKAEAAQKALDPFAETTTRVMQEMSVPRSTFVAKRGDFLASGDPVSPGVPAILPPMADPLPRNRLGLARWLVAPEHPLTARVAVNRIWAELFGRGIVPTPEEFGAQGEPPSHPELLDWLALTFMTSDQWSLKKTVRRIVLSSTYRRSAVVQPAAQEADAPNLWLWRHPGHRLDAETIRDNALAVSGLLSLKMGGPPVYPPQPEGVWRKAAGAGPTSYTPSAGADRYRRGIYTIWKRNGHYPAFATFDAPDRSSCTLQRSRSNTPLQALVLLNDESYVEMARALGKRMASEFQGSVEDRLRLGFRTVLSRKPSATELQTLRDAFEKAREDRPSPHDAFFEVATILLNLHETIHRG
jgi:hypothetical protein